METSGKLKLPQVYKLIIFTAKAAETSWRFHHCNVIVRRSSKVSIDEYDSVYRFPTSYFIGLSFRTPRISQRKRQEALKLISYISTAVS